MQIRGMDAYRRLKAWQHCRALVRDVYRVTAAFPREEQYGISQQLRRAAVSAVANIAESHARYGSAESAHALSVALGSLAEVSALLDLASELGFVGADDARVLEDLRPEASRTTFDLQRKVRG